MSLFPEQIRYPNLVATAMVAMGAHVRQYEQTSELVADDVGFELADM